MDSEDFTFLDCEVKSESCDDSDNSFKFMELASDQSLENVDDTKHNIEIKSKPQRGIQMEEIIVKPDLNGTKANIAGRYSINVSSLSSTSAGSPHIELPSTSERRQNIVRTPVVVIPRDEPAQATVVKVPGLKQEKPASQQQVAAALPLAVTGGNRTRFRNAHTEYLIAKTEYYRRRVLEIRELREYRRRRLELEVRKVKAFEDFVRSSIAKRDDAGVVFLSEMV